MAWEQVVNHGYRAIGAAIGRHALRIEDDQLRLGATMVAQSELSPEHRIIPPYLGSFSDRDAYFQWFLKYRPDAIVGFSTFHYFRLADDRGLRSPEDFAFAALHVSESDPYGKRLAGVIDNIPQVAAAAIDLLDQLIRHHELGVPKVPRDLQIPSVWRDGETLPRIR
jgi:hypothetical protein